MSSGTVRPSAAHSTRAGSRPGRPRQEGATAGPPTTATPLASGGQSGLFGRGLLYVVVWSLQLVAGTVISPVLAHLLGPTQFGALASAIALHQVLSVLALLGLDQALVLQRAEDSDSARARGLVMVGISFSLMVAIVVGATAPLWRDALGFGDF
ncbi:MAG: oligosaccharide flippase family protein [Burkholderiaceae bacterium]|nr:oligosaccharide flippase family protein [Microbacteriaceae bacterium]